MTVSLYSGADIPAPLKAHLREIAFLLNQHENQKPFTMTPVDLSSGSPDEVTFNIPSWAKKVEVMVIGASADGSTDRICCRVGTGGSLISSGYEGASSRIGGTVASTGIGDGFRFNYQDAAQEVHGSFLLTRFSLDSDIWICSSVAGREDNNTTNVCGGSIDVGGPLDVVALAIAGTPTDAFDAGLVGCRYSL